jgi:putative oxidoreductase
MERWLGKYADLFYGLMRIVVGILFMCYGVQKLFGLLGGRGLPAPPLMVLAGVIELVGGGLITIGLWAGTAAFIASGEMAVAYFTSHAPRGFWPIRNGGEHTVLFCFIFFYIACKGSGRLSVDALLKKRR